MFAAFNTADGTVIFSMHRRRFRWSTDGTYERILAAAKSAGFFGDAESDPVVELLSVDSTVVRAHQHAAGARKTDTSEVVSTTGEDTGGTIELQEFAGRAC